MSPRGAERDARWRRDDANASSRGEPDRLPDPAVHYMPHDLAQLADLVLHLLVVKRVDGSEPAPELACLIGAENV
jgi:hypothetical protein